MAQRAYPVVFPASRKERNKLATDCLRELEQDRIWGLAPLYKYTLYGANTHFCSAGFTVRLRLGAFRLKQSPDDADKKSYKKSVYVDIGKQPNPSVALERLLGQEVEWLGWQDGPREIKVEPLSREYAGIVSNFDDDERERDTPSSLAAGTNSGFPH